MVRSFRRLRGILGNDLNDNHYRIDLSMIIIIIYKKTKIAYNSLNILSV